MVYTPSPPSLQGAIRATSGYADPAPNITPNRRDEVPTRTYNVSFLRRDGSVHSARHVAPATPAFEAAFTAFARGTLITTTNGPVAIEDLEPGLKIVTSERGPSPLLWIGSISVRPSQGSGPGLTRIMSDALGMGRPMSDLMTGPGARILHRNASTGEQTLRPIRDLIDGMQVIELRPPSAVQLYHIALQRHATITAAGLEVETYHPGPSFENILQYQQFAQFMSLFPHINRPSDFGSLAHPRRPLGDRPSEGRMVG
ncbi:Hint domain-containing protein [Rhodobacteraceae bacterium KMM 6894]|nr:Hint domain-containing protein [Rhodobacteraceae bacterium KMM 6894]